MDTKIPVFPPFKYFDNNLSLFEVVEFHFPYGDHIAKTRTHLKDSLSKLFVEAEKERLKKLYPSLSTWETFYQWGFVSKIAGHDWSLKQLSLDYHIRWMSEAGPKWIEHFKFARKIKGSVTEICDHEIDKYCELKFFETIAQGVNDALYLEELNNAIIELKQTVKEVSITDKEALVTKADKAISTFDKEERFLRDIWNPGEAHYNKVMDYLKDENDILNKTLLKENKWIGSQAYLRGFINVCKNKGFICTDELKIIQLEKILNNTFHIALKKSDAFKGFFNKEKPTVINGKKKAIETPWEKPFACIPLP